VDELQLDQQRRQQRIAELQAEFEAAQATITADRGTLRLQLTRLAELQAQIATLEQVKETLEAGKSEEQLAKERALAEARALSRQIELLTAQLARVSDVLALKQTEIDAQGATIAELGERLNLALADKVAELAAFRSDFFGRMRNVLEGRPDIRLVGDRFVFQSELLFDSGSAELKPEGQQAMARFASTLREIVPQLPADLPWILRVDGHTDRRPIRTAQFRSNWELSTARAISVARFLIDQGLPAERIAAAGFAENQPLDPGDSEEAFRRNRRIEMQITNS
jgi:chemotaxis protein MotB